MQVGRGFLMQALRHAVAGSALFTLTAIISPMAHAAQTEGGKTTITVGISVGSAEKIFDVVKRVVARDGLEIKLIKFNDYAEQAGLVPARDVIGCEAPDSPYANLIAVRRKDQDQPWVKKLVAAYQSAEVRNFIQTEFKGSLVPASERTT